MTLRQLYVMAMARRSIISEIGFAAAIVGGARAAGADVANVVNPWEWSEVRFKPRETSSPENEAAFRAYIEARKQGRIK